MQLMELKDLDIFSQSSKSMGFRPASDTQNGYESELQLPAETRFKILDFFDWGNMGVWDLQYLVVKVEASSEEALVGKVGLIHARWAEVYAELEFEAD